MSPISSKLPRTTLTKPLICCWEGFSDVLITLRKSHLALLPASLAPKTQAVGPFPTSFQRIRHQDSRTNQFFKSPLTVFMRDEPDAFIREQASAQNVGTLGMETSAKQR